MDVNFGSTSSILDPLCPEEPIVVPEDKKDKGRWIKKANKKLIKAQSIRCAFRHSHWMTVW